MAESQTRRSIRSYVKRESRMSHAQHRALVELWPNYGCDLAAVDAPRVLFLRDALCYLEIGFGNGENLASLAVLHPDCDFLGVEVHRPGVGQCLRLLAEFHASNVRVVNADILQIIQPAVWNQQLDGIYLLFPDPWPKRRHHKRRLVSASFIESLGACLKPGGYLYIATDWEPYAAHCIELLQSQSLLHPAKDPERLPNFIARTPTRYEKRGLRLGHPIQELIYQRSLS